MLSKSTCMDKPIDKEDNNPQSVDSESWAINNKKKRKLVQFREQLFVFPLLLLI